MSWAPNRPAPKPSDGARNGGERWLLAGLADDDAELLRQAANEVAAEWADREAARLLLDAATVAEIGA